MGTALFLVLQLVVETANGYSYALHSRGWVVVGFVEIFSFVGYDTPRAQVVTISIFVLLDAE